MWKKGNPRSLLMGMQTGADTMENSMKVPQKIKMVLLHNPTIPLLDIYPKKSKTNSKGHIYPNVYCSIFNNSQGMEAT